VSTGDVSCRDSASPVPRPLSLARLPAATPRLETLSDLDTPEDLAQWPGL